MCGWVGLGWVWLGVLSETYPFGCHLQAALERDTQNCLTSVHCLGLCSLHRLAQTHPN